LIAEGVQSADAAMRGGSVFLEWALTIWHRRDVATQSA
jgi:hypothetical protein